MGEAIAAFRKYALRARESLDLWRFEPDCDDTTMGQGRTDPIFSPHDDWHSEASFNVHDMGVDRRPVAEYVEDLHRLQEHFEKNFPKPLPQQTAGAQPKKPAFFTLTKREDFYFKRREGRAALRRLADEAIRESVGWSALAGRVEWYSRHLFDSTERLVHMVANSLLSERATDAKEYAFLLEQWFDAFDGLSPFEGEPADAASSAASDAAEEAFPARSAGRPKMVDERLEKALVDEYLAMKQEYASKGEKPLTKEQFVAGRNRDAVKDPKRLLALNAEHFRILENGLRSRRRKRQQTRTKRR